MNRTIPNGAAIWFVNRKETTMDRNFQRAISLVLKHEGGWADNPKDPGGATMKGVTLANFRRYVKPGATKDDLRKITDAQIATVYRRYYWDAVAGAELPDGIDYAVFDFAVNSGPTRAAQYLQKVVGVAQDGKVGPATLKATKAMLPATVIHNLCDERLAFLKRIKSKGKLLWDTFGKGWSRRVQDVRAESLSLSGRPTPEKPAIIEKTIEVPVEKPVVPETVEKAVKKQTNGGSWLIGAGGVAGTAVTGAFGANWETVVAVGGVALVALLLLFVMRRQIIAAVKEIRGEVEA